MTTQIKYKDAYVIEIHSIQVSKLLREVFSWGRNFQLRDWFMVRVKSIGLGFTFYPKCSNRSGYKTCRSVGNNWWHASLATSKLLAGIDVPLPFARHGKQANRELPSRRTFRAYSEENCATKIRRERASRCSALTVSTITVLAEGRCERDKTAETSDCKQTRISSGCCFVEHTSNLFAAALVPSRRLVPPWSYDARRTTIQNKICRK